MLLIEQLKQIPDHRNIRGKNDLWFILMLSLMGSLCGYIGYRPLADFSKKHQVLLEKLFEWFDDIGSRYCAFYPMVCS
jgi:DDE_Tnp_1-associated